MWQLTEPILLQGTTTALMTKETDNYPDHPPYELKISFQKGKATVTVTGEECFIKAVETLTVGRKEKPKSLEVMKHAEPHRLE